MIQDVDTQELDAQRAGSIRLLLDCPMVGRADTGFTGVAIHGAWLTGWFAEVCGWDLRVDVRGGFARLSKISPPDSYAAAAQDRPDRPFDRRTYTLWCLLAAALGEHGRARISLRAIAEAVVDMSVRADVKTFAPDTSGGERRRLVRAIRLTESCSILSERHRVGEDYVKDVKTNVLYDIDERRLALLIAAPTPPAYCTSWPQLLNAGPDDDAADGADHPGSRTRALHRVMRLLLDDAVCELESLDEQERACLTADAGRIKGWLAQAGLDLERRAEYWAAIDTAAAPSQWVLPKDTIPSNAALLLLDHVSAQDTAWITERGVEEFIARLLQSHPKWAKSWRDRDRPRQLAAQAVSIVARLGLLAADDAGWRASPAARRWRIALEAEPLIPAQPGASTADQPSLFQEDPA
jgi:uncharacterized protein (TIGR02678 family)